MSGSPRCGSCLYTLAWGAGLALASPYLLLRGCRDRREWTERWGGVSGLRHPGGARCWIHAASVGEARAAEHLIAALATRGAAPYLSVVTPAARALEAQWLARGAVGVHFAPFDFAPCMRARARRLRPAALLVLETEIWPAMLNAARRARLPVAFVSARLTTRGAHRLRRVRRWLAPLLAPIHVAAQSPADAERWRCLGVDRSRLRVTGNLKYAAPAPLPAPAARAAARAGWERVWVLGSVRSGETEAVAAAAEACRDLPGPLLLVVVPRHPERSAATLRSRLRELLPLVERRAPGEPLLPSPEQVVPGTPAARQRAILLVSSLGELRRYYALADLAFVGGTLCPRGGHNLFEAAEAGLPVLYGPSIETVRDVATALEASGGGRRVADTRALMTAARDLLSDETVRHSAARAARRTAGDLGGALEATVAALTDWRFPLGSQAPDGEEP